jgi:hypothetical protein
MPPELPQQPPAEGIQLSGFPKPPIAPSGAASALTEAAARTESQLTELVVHSNELNRMLDYNDAMGALDDKANDIAETIRADPKLGTDPDAAKAAFNSQLDAQTPDILKQFPAANYNNRFTKNADIKKAHWSLALYMNAAHGQLVATDQRLTDSMPQAIARATNPSLPAADQQTNFGNYLGAINDAQNNHGLPADKADAHRQVFLTGVINESFRNYARQNPGAVLGMDKPPDLKTVVPKWVSDAMPNGVITPEQLDQEKGIARETLDSNQKNVDATVNADLGRQETDILNLKAAGKPYLPQLQRYMEHGGNPRFFANLQGQQWIRSNPDLTNHFVGQLHTAGLQDIPHILDDAAVARGNNLISGNDYATVARVAVQRKAEGETADRRNEAVSWNSTLKDPAFTSLIHQNKWGAIAMDKTAVTEGQLHTAFHAYWLQFHDPAKVNAALLKQFSLSPTAANPGATEAMGRLHNYPTAP